MTLANLQVQSTDYSSQLIFKTVITNTLATDYQTARNNYLKA